MLTLLKLFQTRGFVYAFIVALVAVLSFWVGSRFSAAQYERELRSYETRIADIAEAITISQNEIIDRHNRALEVERKRFNESQKVRKQVAKEAQKVLDETSNSTNSSWDANQRLRLQELYRIYGYTD